MYDEIVNRYYNVILNYCKYKLNGNKTAAEDITQEVFFVLYRKRNHLKMGDNIKLWLYRAADNQIKAYIRKNPSFQPIDELSDLAAVSEISEITDSAFDFLTPEELALITEYYDGDKAAAARKNNISMNGLYIRIHRIKKKLLDSAVRMNKINK